MAGNSVFKYAAGKATNLAKSMNPKEPIFKKSGRRGIDNLFSGYELGGSGKLLATAGIVAYGGVTLGDISGAQKEYQLRELAKRESEEQDIESLISTRGDGVGYTGNVGSLSNNLQANGDLVFALHKLRNGG